MLAGKNSIDELSMFARMAPHLHARRAVEHHIYKIDRKAYTGERVGRALPSRAICRPLRGGYGCLDSPTSSWTRRCASYMCAGLPDVRSVLNNPGDPSSSSYSLPPPH
uniref:Expressed protein n=1 Tax=Schizophyllum commune (strain H4-8 / FGSC 9210) TaxID=578458 RepID=D8PR53_SCHCM